MNQADVIDMAIEICRVGQRNIKDFTKRGRCTKCGECCSNQLPLSKSEIARILSYAAAHKLIINEPKNGICPFLSKDKRCMVYEVRPLVCRLFKCSTPTPTYKDFALFMREDRAIMNVTQTFSRLVK